MAKKKPGRGAPQVVDEFALGDRQFRVTRSGDTYGYQWTNHPEKLGFESAGAMKGKVDHRMVVRAFLAMLDPETEQLRRDEP